MERRSRAPLAHELPTCAQVSCRGQATQCSRQPSSRRVLGHGSCSSCGCGDAFLRSNRGPETPRAHARRDPHRGGRGRCLRSRDSSTSGCEIQPEASWPSAPTRTWTRAKHLGGRRRDLRSSALPGAGLADRGQHRFCRHTPRAPTGRSGPRDRRRDRAALSRHRCGDSLPGPERTHAVLNLGGLVARA